MMVGLRGAAAVLAAVIAAGPVAAQCVTAADLARGVLFERQGEGLGSGVALPGGGVQVNYEHGRDGYADRRDMAMGLYETAVSHVTDPPDVVGAWSFLTESREHAGRFPAPEPGRTWETTITRRWEISDYSGMPQSGQERIAAVYAFLDPVEASLSGCAYQVIPVEVRLTSDERDVTRRYAFFPAIGMAIETRVTDHRTGEVVTHGITALRAVP